MAKKVEVTEVEEEFYITDEETAKHQSLLEIRWNKLIPKIMKAYPTLTKDDLLHREGSGHKRWEIMMKKTGLSHNDLEKFLNSLE